MILTNLNSWMEWKNSQQHTIKLIFNNSFEQNQFQSFKHTQEIKNSYVLIFFYLNSYRQQAKEIDEMFPCIFENSNFEDGVNEL